MITLYLLPNEVNDKQITILGSEVTLSTNTNPKLIII